MSKFTGELYVWLNEEPRDARTTNLIRRAAHDLARLEEVEELVRRYEHLVSWIDSPEADTASVIRGLKHLRTISTCAARRRHMAYAEKLPPEQLPPGTHHMRRGISKGEDNE